MPSIAAVGAGCLVAHFAAGTATAPSRMGVGFSPATKYVRRTLLLRDDLSGTGSIPGFAAAAGARATAPYKFLAALGARAQDRRGDEPGAYQREFFRDRDRGRASRRRSNGRASLPALARIQLR